MLFHKHEELIGEIHEDAYFAYENEMKKIQEDCMLHDYVVMENGNRCYLDDGCDAYNNVCNCR